MSEVNHTISTSNVAVDLDYYWIPIDSQTPMNVKLQLLSNGGLPSHGHLTPKETFYTHWTPLPRRRS
jgi:hypothetical protein